MSGINLFHGDCLDVLRGMADNSVDSIVTDPPYGLSFMGKKWDYDVPSTEIWAECLRVLKPGGHLLAFAGTRTQHRMAVRIEDAGFEIRDLIFWCYASGFPKSLDVSKAIDKAAGAEREVVGTKLGLPGYSLTDGTAGGVAMQGNVDGSLRNGAAECAITAPATDAARQWQGWGTALKPALEPITVARKPLIGTVVENVLTHGTGGLNIDGCRVESGGEHKVAGVVTKKTTVSGDERKGAASGMYGAGAAFTPTNHEGGRWPANLIHDGSDDVLVGFPVTARGSAKPRVRDGAGSELGQGSGWKRHENKPSESQQYADGGSAARFFYCAKTSKKDRGDGNNHPTVKPTDLMRYLCRLVTPPKGVVLDPFMGSGSTGKAARLEGFGFIGIERDAAYFAIAQRRIDAATAQAGLFAEDGAHV